MEKGKKLYTTGGPFDTFLKRVAPYARAILIAEAGLLAGSYAVFVGLNHDREFRWWMNQKFPYVLDRFYALGEYMDENYKARELDKETWSIENNLMDQKKT